MMDTPYANISSKAKPQINPKRSLIQVNPTLDHKKIDKTGES